MRDGGEMTERDAGKPVVVGVDASEPSVAALRYAARLAVALQKPLEAITAWSYPPLASADSIQAWSPEEDAEQNLDAALTRAFGEFLPPSLSRRVVAGPPALTLIARSEDAEMLVVGNRGVGGFAGLLLGSVSAACVSHARCPVLVVR